MAVSVKRVFGPAAIANGTSTLFTGTVGHKYVFRVQVTSTNTSSTIRTLTLGIGGVTAALSIMYQQAIAGKVTLPIPVLVVIEGAETLQASASGTGLTATGFGIDQT